MASQHTAKHRKASTGRVSGILAVALGTTLWGTVGPVVELFPEGTAFQYAMVRNVTGTLALWILVLFSRKKKRYTKQDIVPILIGGVGVAFFFPLFTLGFQRTGVAVAAVLAIGVAPIFAGIIARIAFKHKPGKTWLIGTAVAISGVVALNWPSGDAVVNVLGVSFSLMAAFAYSWQATGMGMISQRHTPFQCVAPIFTVGTILQAPINIGRDFSFLYDPKLLAGTLYGGIATVAIAYAFFTYGISRIGTATSVTVGLMEPLTATTMGVLLLGETISPIGMAGLVLVLIGLIIVSRPTKEIV
ncbi:MAG: EamA family transporter [Actinomycetes bacterium]